MRAHTTHHDDCGCLRARFEKRIEVLEAALSNCADFIEDVKLTDAKDKKLKPVMLRMCKTAITRKEGKK